MCGAATRGGLAAAIIAAFVVPATAAHAAPPGRALAKTGPAPEPPLPLTLTLDAPTPRGTWTMRVTNDGEAPVAITADARGLVFEVTPRGARRPVKCSLPADMRAADELDRLLVIPPHRAYSERFEPRLYCVGGNRLEALAPGAMVVATLAAGPHATHSAPIALPDEPAPTFDPKDAPPPSPYPEPALNLFAPVQIDAPDADGIEIPITLTNTGKRTAQVRFRPETLGFEVLGPTGANHCPWPTLISAPTREVFSSIPPGASESMTVLLTAYCARTAFTQPGLYVLRASFDSRRASGAEIGIAQLRRPGHPGGADRRAPPPGDRASPAWAPAAPAGVTGGTSARYRLIGATSSRASSGETAR